MLLKLLKYDFRAMWKQFSLIWGAALALALVNRFTLDGQNSTSMVGEQTSGLMIFAFTAVMTAMFVIAILFVVQRFSKGLLGDEGYLMHTLPVRPWQLVTSKLICGTVTWVVCSAVSFLSALVMLPLDLSDLLQFPFWSDILRGIMKHPGVVALIVEFLLMALAAMIQFTAAIYLAIAIGHLFSRHRRLISIASFIGLYVLVGNVYDQVFSYRIVRALTNAASVNAYGSMLVAIAIMLIPAIVFLAVTCWILEHKLNLE